MFIEEFSPAEPFKVRHIMLDLETMGKKRGCAPIAIGAVLFGFNGPIPGGEFYRKIDLDSCVKHGLHIDPSTVRWWLGQDDKARREFTEDKNLECLPLPEALADFSAWMRQVAPEPDIVRMWGNGAGFDNGILDECYDVCGHHKPWKFWGDRCYRTLKGMFPNVAKPAFEGTAHNALDDARFQARHVAAIVQFLNANLP